jgi:hypothetical protein
MSATAAVSPSETSPFEELRGRIEQLPSGRDWSVYQAVRVEQWTTRVAAEEFGLSQTRVCQIVQRVAAFIAEAVPVPSKEGEARQVAVGRQLAADRIDYLYGEALRCFRISQSNKSEGCKPGRRNFGEARYLLAAARLAMQASTLPPPKQLWQADEEQPVERDVTKAAAKAPQTCSAPSAEQSRVAPPPATQPVASAAAKQVCAEPSRGNEPVNRVAPRPVQNEDTSGPADNVKRRQPLGQADFSQTG